MDQPNLDMLIVTLTVLADNNMRVPVVLSLAGAILKGVTGSFEQYSEHIDTTMGRALDKITTRPDKSMRAALKLSLAAQHQLEAAIETTQKTPGFLYIEEDGVTPARWWRIRTAAIDAVSVNVNTPISA